MNGLLGDSLFDNVLDIIKKWNPKEAYKGELKYRDDLLDFIRKELNRPKGMFNPYPQEQIVIKKEDGRGLADIAINRRIGIELKLNLKGKSQRNRLVGQIDDFLRDYKKLIVVLCGNTNTEELEELKRKAEEISRPVGFGLEESKKVVVITKKHNENKENKKTSRGGSFFNLEPPKIEFKW